MVEDIVNVVDRKKGKRRKKGEETGGAVPADVSAGTGTGQTGTDATMPAADAAGTGDGMPAGEAAGTMAAGTEQNAGAVMTAGTTGAGQGNGGGAEGVVNAPSAAVGGKAVGGNFGAYDKENGFGSVWGQQWGGSNMDAQRGGGFSLDGYEDEMSDWGGTPEGAGGTKPATDAAGTGAEEPAGKAAGTEADGAKVGEDDGEQAAKSKMQELADALGTTYEKVADAVKKGMETQEGWKMMYDAEKDKMLEEDKKREEEKKMAVVSDEEYNGTLKALMDKYAKPVGGTMPAADAAGTGADGGAQPYKAANGTAANGTGEPAANAAGAGADGEVEVKDVVPEGEVEDVEKKVEKAAGKDVDTPTTIQDWMTREKELMDMMEEEEKKEKEEQRKKNRMMVMWQAIVGIGELIARAVTGASGEMVTGKNMMQTQKEMVAINNEKIKELREKYKYMIESGRKSATDQFNREAKLREIERKERVEKDNHAKMMKQIDEMEDKAQREKARIDEQARHNKAMEDVAAERAEAARIAASARLSGGGRSAQSGAADRRAKEKAAQKRRDDDFVSSVRAKMTSLDKKYYGKDVKGAKEYVKSKKNDKELQEIMRKYDEESK